MRYVCGLVGAAMAIGVTACGPAPERSQGNASNAPEAASKGRAVAPGDWPLINRDLTASRYSPLTILPVSRAFRWLRTIHPRRPARPLREFLTSALWPEMVLVATVLGILDGICGRGNLWWWRRPRLDRGEDSSRLGSAVGCQSPRWLGRFFG